jgi:AraC family transcriptional regulator
MNADIHTLYASEFYHVLDFKCRCTDCSTSEPEYSESFCISFVRKGNFLFNVFRQSFDSYNGCVLISKPCFERTVTHIHDIPDECTIFEFKSGFYEHLMDQYAGLKFLFDQDRHSALVKVNGEAEHLHRRILEIVHTKTASKLEVDGLVLEVIDCILGKLGNQKEIPVLDDRLKRNHLTTIENAKEYINTHFHQDISLTEMAKFCHVSLFHFSRIFKTITSYTPHQFLLAVRLKHAELLLKNTTLPVIDIAISSGFNSAEHFTAAFSRKYKQPPTALRVNISSI